MAQDLNLNDLRQFVEIVEHRGVLRHCPGTRSAEIHRLAGRMSGTPDAVDPALT